MKRAYTCVLRGLGGLLRSLGVLARLERRAPRSRVATWAVSLFAIYDIDELARLDVPWWTFDSIDHVADFLAGRPGARVFEWGSGASTLWLASRSGSVHSVEHDAGWAEALRPRLPANVDLTLVPPTATPAPAIGSAKPGHAGLDFSTYVAAIDETHGLFDVVVIDGRAREACLERAVGRLAPDGLIVFDNVDRQRYRDAIGALGGRLDVITTRGLTPALPYPTRTALLRLAGPA
ncbi:class I SAM-dependent methyltransferase [Nocardioides mangrovi]|uniref:Class I SAM-dependent methyltransferase n=1 Tax=Nocardioides mangrovi TaxID=2874580 RepID=A0ABS7U932_9ACTN|nr:class I SAM-dependent methyltransferase [Nocardioides mangrovi]MBZ5737494.1 class I SAM-dependent methyltransferase [Nocardioides mangrovi]